MSTTRPENVGVLAMEMYTPARYVPLTELEKADNCAGKYTVGLGQLNMGFCDDREDVTSIFMTAVHSLLEKYSIDPNSIGRVEVGTETQIDKSKSVKTSLMKLFGSNTDIEGITNVNACYGGTAALFNSIAWIESSEWNGKNALVVCGDIAVYEAGPARPTGGCGAVAMLIGPDAPLVLEPGVRATHALDVYDFYKPTHTEYAMVDGKLSQWAYLSSVDTCYRRYKEKYSAKHPTQPVINVDHFDYFAFHSPYNKLVQKGFARFLYVDLMTLSSDNTSAAGSGGAGSDEMYKDVISFKSVPVQETYESRELEAAFRTLSNSRFMSKVMPACKINQNIGNCYTGSVFASLLSVVSEKGGELEGKRVCMYSYGSGSMASLYSFVGRTPSSGSFSLERIAKTVNIFDRLQLRKECSFAEFTSALDLRAIKYGKAPMQPDGPINAFTPGTYYLTSINDKHHREYLRA